MGKVTFAILLAIFLGLVGVLGDFFVKLASSSPKSVVKYFIIGSLVYASTAFGWFYVYRHMKLATSAVFYAISTILFLTAVGIFYFKERLNTYEIIGIIMAIISLVLLKKFV